MVGIGRRSESGLIMEKLLTPSDVAGILQVSKRKAYDLMKGMARIEKPLRVTEGSLREWIANRAVTPGNKPKYKLSKNWIVERRCD